MNIIYPPIDLGVAQLRSAAELLVVAETVTTDQKPELHDTETMTMIDFNASCDRGNCKRINNLGRLAPTGTETLPLRLGPPASASRLLPS